MREHSCTSGDSSVLLRHRDAIEPIVKPQLPLTTRSESAAEPRVRTVSRVPLTSADQNYKCHDVRIGALTSQLLLLGPVADGEHEGSQPLVHPRTQLQEARVSDSQSRDADGTKAKSRSHTHTFFFVELFKIKRLLELLIRK